MEFYIQAPAWYRYLHMVSETNIELTSLPTEENVLGRNAVAYSETIRKFCGDTSHFLPELSEGDYYYSFSEPLSKNNNSMRQAFKYVISCYKNEPNLFETVDQLCKKKMTENSENENKKENLMYTSYMLKSTRHLNRNLYETMNMEINVEIYPSKGSVDMAKITRC